MNSLIFINFSSCLHSEPSEKSLLDLRNWLISCIFLTTSWLLWLYRDNWWIPVHTPFLLDRWLVFHIFSTVFPRLDARTFARILLSLESSFFLVLGFGLFLHWVNEFPVNGRWSRFARRLCSLFHSNRRLYFVCVWSARLSDFWHTWSCCCIVFESKSMYCAFWIFVCV